MSRLLDAVIRGAIQGRFLVLLAAAALFAYGLWTTQRARLDALPNFSPSLVVVQAEAPGLGSTSVERLVTTPLEQALLGIPDLARVRSTSSAGLSVLQLTFADDVDIFRARQLVAERLAEARGRLSPTLPAPRLAPITAPVGSLIKLSYTSDRTDPEAANALWEFVQWQVWPRLSGIEGIARVTVHGGAAARVEVRPDVAAMANRGIDVDDLRRVLSTAQSLALLGYADGGVQREPLRAEGLWAWGDLDAIGRTVVTVDAGIPVRVSDVATVMRGNAPPVGTARYDGRDAIYVQVEKVPWEDTMRLTTAVEAALVELDTQMPLGTTRQPPTFRQADFIETSLSALAREAVTGAALAVVVLIVFLGSPRLVVISVSVLPLSIVAAAAVLIQRGVTINGMILGGLAIAVGEIVDDAIVDVENIWRRLRENAACPSPRPALEVILGASVEVRGAVVHATLIVIAVLTPIMVLGGLTGRIFSPLAETYALAVAASLLVALTVTPAACAILLPRVAGARTGDTRVGQALRQLYDGVLGLVGRGPGKVVAISAALGLAALCVLPFLAGGFLPEFREGVLIAEVTANPGTSLEETTRIGSRIDAVLREHADVAHVAARAGRASLDEDAAPVHRMELDLVLPETAEDPERVGEAIAAELGTVPGIRFGVEGFLGERINELLSGERAPIAIKLSGDDLDALRTAAATVMNELSTLEGVSEVRAPGLVDVPTTDLVIDEPGLQRAGLHRGDVVDLVALWRQGLRVADLYVPGGFSAPVVLVEATADEALAELPVFTRSGAVLPLSSMVHIEHAAEPAAIQHEGGRRLLAITARADSGELSRIAARIERMLSKATLPPGASWELSGQAIERREASGRLGVLVALVLAAIFAFLWLAFGSPADAAIVLGLLPLGLVGGVVAALLVPDGLSMAGLIGFVALTGTTTRNGVMLVAHKLHLEAAEPDVDPETLVLRAARERVLPILMTAATTFFGLLPLAASVGTAGSELESPMALIMCAGLVSSTALNLITVPSVYLWLAQRRRRREAR